MVEELKPHVLKREISVKADLVQIAFRKLREVCGCSSADACALAGALSRTGRLHQAPI